MGAKTSIPLTDVLSLHKPDTSVQLPLIFDSPHSGTFYPADFGYNCTFDELRKLEDAYIDDLFSAAPKHAATLLCALFARSYIDPNRGIDDIDEQMLTEPWPEYVYEPLAPTEFSERGIGLIAKNIDVDTVIYTRVLALEEVIRRISAYYVPYHRTLKHTIDKAYKQHGNVWHINLHSMPSLAAYPKEAKKFSNGNSCPSDIVLGNLDGYSCEPSFTRMLQNFWEKLGYNVTINDPFKGAELIACYGRPNLGINSLQIEINRSLYMDEQTGKPNSSYNDFKKHCTQMIIFCAQYCKTELATKIKHKQKS